MPLRTCLSICSTSTDDSTLLPKPPRHVSTTSDPTTSSSSSLHSALTFPTLQTLQTPQPTPLYPHKLLSTTQTPHHLPITSLALSTDHRLLYIATTSAVSAVDSLSLHPLSSLPTPSSAGAVKSLSFDSRLRLFTAHQDGRIRVWSSPHHRPLASLPTLPDRLRRLPLPKNYVHVRRHRRRLWIEHADAVSALVVSGNLIYSASWDKTLKIWRTSDLRCVESVAAHDDAINAVAVAGDGTVYTASADRRVRVWSPDRDSQRHVLIATLEKHKSSVNALALSEDGRILYSGACDRSILVWEREESADHMVVRGALRGHTRAILCLMNVGDLLFSGSADRTVRMWRRVRGSGQYCCVGVLEGHVRGVKALVAFREGEDTWRVCSGDLDGEVRVWKVWVSGGDICGVSSNNNCCNNGTNKR
ncbi:hypothetical protein QJS04_geneDACA021693 [Acorus gramineus]|uniref:Uncharacterized protein n=1 Tax=Acorus gramineus TaxID=55184 RepID=A0AAV8ZYI7_ACOGR|nr:hypothetical protein QJS04_geneDACA021693 [Acorus gramineus]